MSCLIPYIIEIGPSNLHRACELASTKVTTRISETREDDVIIRGYPISELILKVPFGDGIFLVLSERFPTKAESRVFNGILVSLIEHGMLNQALVARWVIRTAPESVQGAMAAGLLGVGDQFGGASERVGEMLAQGVRQMENAGQSSGEVADSIVTGYLERKERVPGFGHTIHRSVDPRAEILLDIAKRERVSSKHVDLLELVKNKLEVRTGKTLVINAMGAIGAIILDLGLDWRIAKGLMVVSKAPGILAHVHEEMRQPVISELLPQIRNLIEYEGLTARKVKDDYPR